eukprot:TRINITY_DN21707_c0_g1_i1.p1 TRINITY_DN21707_c0_g1~~TRINITY_DN21707_c0_g1_i1.p1  ORF type:complete len:355 (+),score=113.53 TRINITY_DN21707_c0_g1_i1:56-1120(+)
MAERSEDAIVWFLVAVGMIAFVVWAWWEVRNPGGHPNHDPIVVVKVRDYFTRGPGDDRRRGRAVGQAPNPVGSESPQSQNLRQHGFRLWFFETWYAAAKSRLERDKRRELEEQERGLFRSSDIGTIDVKVDAYGDVIEVAEGSDAQEKGVQPGDKIIAVQCLGTRYWIQSRTDFERQTGPESGVFDGVTVTLLYLRGNHAKLEWLQDSDHPKAKVRLHDVQRVSIVARSEREAKEVRISDIESRLLSAGMLQYDVGAIYNLLHVPQLFAAEVQAAHSPDCSTDELLTRQDARDISNALLRKMLPPLLFSEPKKGKTAFEEASTDGLSVSLETFIPYVRRTMLARVMPLLRSKDV